MEAFKSLMSLFIPDHCYDELFVNLNFLHIPCLSILFSKGIGYTMVVLSIFVKLPQIMKIIRAQSAEGINFMSCLMEISAISFTVSYSYASNFPFSAWGEGVFLGIQSVITGYLVLKLNGYKLASVLYVVSYSIVMYLLCSGIVPYEFLITLQGATIPTIVTARLSQAWTNLKNQNTGQLSAVTCFMLFGGALVRVFTAYIETGDFLFILTYVLSATVNGLIAGQIVWYWAETARAELTKDKRA